MRRVRAIKAVGWIALGLAIPVASVLAQSGGGLYTCTNASGKRLTSDRRIAECNDREQRVLNSDGSVRETIGPSLTNDERAVVEAHARDLEYERARKFDAIRIDRNLMARFPNQAAHNKARANALDVANTSLQASEQRLAKLAQERKPLDSEAEFYSAKTLPAGLKAQIDANDASVDAQRMLVQNQRLEIVRINTNYDNELDHLKQLWAGAPAGSLGMVADAASSPAAKRR